MSAKLVSCGEEGAGCSQKMESQKRMHGTIHAPSKSTQLDLSSFMFWLEPCICLFYIDLKWTISKIELKRMNSFITIFLGWQFVGYYWYVCCRSLIIYLQFKWNKFKRILKAKSLIFNNSLYTFMAETYPKGCHRSYTYGGGIGSTEGEPWCKASASVLHSLKIQIQILIILYIHCFVLSRIILVLMYYLSYLELYCFTIIKFGGYFVGCVCAKVLQSFGWSKKGWSKW